MMWSIDETIGNVEKLYSAVTGKEAPAGDAVYAPIPAEKDPLEHVEEQLARLLDTFDGTPLNAASAAPPRWSPPLSVWETDTELFLCFELPGVKREDVELTSQRNVLTVSGTRAPKAGVSLRATEAPLGPFRRMVVLPPDVKAAEPSAQMRDGILEIRLAREAPEKEAPKPVRVN